MNEQQTPKHPEFRKRIVTRLNSAHTLLAKQTDSNVSCFDHWNIVRTISNRQSDLVEVGSDYSDNLGFLDGQKSATNNSITVFCKIGEFNFTFRMTYNWSQICSLDQKPFGISLLVQILSLFCQFLKSSNNMFRILAVIPQNLEMRLNEVATFSDILCSLHLVSCQHPNFYFYIDQYVLALIRSLIVSGTQS